MRNIEEKVLRELHSTHSLNELNPGQRKNLHQFCKTWVDIFIDLDMLEEESFEEFINDALKGKSDKEIKDWYFNQIVDCELKLSKERDAKNIECLKEELRILSLRAFGFCGMHLHTVKVV